MAARTTNILATTLEKIKGQIADAVIDAQPLLKHLKGKGNMVTLDGGTAFYTPIALAKNPGGFYTPGGQTCDTFGAATQTAGIDTDQIQAAEYPWTYLYTYTMVTGDEKMQNMGKAQAASLVKAKVDMAKKTLADYLDQNIYDYDANSASGFVGLDLICPTPAGSGALGGLNSSAGYSPAWTSFYSSCASNSFATLSADMLAMWMSSVGKNGLPKVVVMHTDLYEYYEGTIGVTGARYLDYKHLDIGFQAATYKGRPILVSDRCTDAGSEECVYMLDTDYLGFFVHKDRNISVEPFRRSESLLDADYSRIYWMGNLFCRNRRVQGVITYDA